MKVLIFSWKDLYHPWAGGSEVNMHEQARRWVEMGHEVTLFTSRPEGSPHRDNIEGVNVYRAGRSYLTFLFGPLYYLALLHKHADVVLDIINGVPFFTPLFVRKPKIALIHHVHRDMFVPELGPVLGEIGKAIERYLLPLLYRGDPVICVSESTASSIRNRLFGGKHLDVRVVYNGIDTDMYSPVSGEKSATPTVLYLGRLKPYKQLPKLIRIMHKVRERVPDVKLIVAGAGEAILEAEAEVKLHDADDYVHFLWQVSDEAKVELYQQAWVSATASMIEGWGLTVIEANACGTPTVAFDVPGLNESIVHGRTGMLAHDDDEFVEDLVDILSDEALRGRLADGALKWSNDFSWDATAGQTLEILKEAVKNSASRNHP